MADPLRHSCKLDIAEEILEFITNNPDAEEVRATLKNHLELTYNDLEMANGVVHDLSNLIRDQEF